jgi:hypothetical protein
VSPDGQGFGRDITTLTAHLRGVLRRDFHHSPTSFFRFVFEYLHELFPAGVVDAPGKGMILDHTLDVQRFDHDNAVIVSVTPGDLAQEILALAGHLQVYLGDGAGRLLAAMGALLTSRKFALRSAELLVALSQVARVSDLVSLGIGEKDLESYVDADGGSALKNRGVFQLADDQHVPLAVGPQPQVHGPGDTFKRPVLLNLYALAQLARHFQPAFAQAHVSTLTVLSEVDRMPAVGCFEPREAGRLPTFLAGYETPECLVESISEHLYRACRNAFATATLEASGECVLEEKLAGLSVVVFDQREHLIVEVAGHYQTSHEKLALAAVWVEPIFEGFHHLEYLYRIKNGNSLCLFRATPLSGRRHFFTWSCTNQVE